MKVLFVVVAVLAFAWPAAAQQTHGYGFLGGTFGGPRGGMGGALRYGIGGQGTIAPRVALGAEIGGIQKHGSGVVVSGHAAFHPSVRSRGAQVDPFVLGGMALARAGGETGAYLMLGGGLNYWWQPNFGFRAEFRGYPGGNDLNGFAEFRFGIAFR